MSRAVICFACAGSSAAFAAAQTYVDNIFQLSNSGIVKTITGPLYDRHNNPYVGIRIFIGGFSNGSQIKNPVDGDTWILTNTRAADGSITETHTIVYDGATDCVTYDGAPTNPPACGFAIPAGQTGLKGWFFRVPFYGKCEFNGDHVMNVAYNGTSIIGAPRTYHPTRLRPVVKSLFAPSKLTPKLREENIGYGLQAEEEIPGEKQKIETVVLDTYGCNRVPTEIEMDMRTTFVSSGGHAHFTGSTERGDGIFTPITPDAEVNSDPTITGVRGPLPSDPLSIHNGRFAAFYQAGEFGVQEKLAITAKLPKNAEEPSDVSATRSETITVRLNDLGTMSADAADHMYVFGTGCYAHNPTARTGTSAVAQALARVARSYHLITTNRLSFNDLGLQYGGAFDNGSRTSSCHVTHRRGVDVDVNSTDIGFNQGQPWAAGATLDTEVEANGVTLTRLEWLKRFMCRENFERYEGEATIHYRVQPTCDATR